MLRYCWRSPPSYGSEGRAVTRAFRYSSELYLGVAEPHRNSGIDYLARADHPGIADRLGSGRARGSWLGPLMGWFGNPSSWGSSERGVMDGIGRITPWPSDFIPAQEQVRPLAPDVAVHPLHCFQCAASAGHFFSIWTAAKNSVADGLDLFFNQVSAIINVSHQPEPPQMV